MQSLVLANDLFSRFEAGKRATVRAGHRDIRLGALDFQSAEEQNGQFLHEMVEVVEVRHKLAGDLTYEEAQADGAATNNDLITALLRFYPKLQPEDEVTIVFFIF